jgi:L-2-hydroxyglutarate oxidase LhgO
MTADVQTIVIGAGVVGLAIARELAVRGQEVLVVEQHDLIGSETSSRNSEVIHAGIYYPPGSLRAKLCVEGKAKLYRFCAENGVPHKAITKLLVATNESQLPKLKAIQETAIKNGVGDLQPLTGAEARKLEPEVACVAALLSPSTGIIDSHSLMIALEGHAEAAGAQVVLNTPVSRIGRTGGGLFEVETGAETVITAKSLVLSAGLHASKLARTYPWTANYRPPETYYAVGQYYAYSGKSPFGRHIYPMPDGAWLGLHVTVDIGGRCKFGPDIEWIPEIDYSFDETKLEKFLGFIRTYYPALDPSRLHADYTGIRPKLYREGEPVPDFLLHGSETHGVDGLMMLFGIESPGLTASMAIGELVAARLGAMPAAG